MRILELPEEVVKRIAAGEVVTRPVSVVKELIENSVDAEAKTITLIIENGGKSLIEVVDDGIGMEKDEILLAIKSHTTSKIKSIDDLYNLSTYGFRGEALASIVNVSETVITSKTAEQTVGTEVIVKGGEVVKISKIACNKGTSIKVKNLFFNIPARRKFLSSANIEGRMINELFQKFLLSLPQIHLIFTKDGEQTYNCPPTSNIVERIITVFPELTPDHLVKVDMEEETMKIEGYVTRPGIGLKNRTGQIFFVNGRYVRVSQLYKTLETAFGSSSSLYPYSVIYLQVPSDMIDVNVHPQKLEVKFSRYQRLHNLIIRAIREATRSNIVHKINIQKDMNLKSKEKIISDRYNQNKNETQVQRTSTPRKTVSPKIFDYKETRFREPQRVGEPINEIIDTQKKISSSEKSFEYLNLKVLGVLGERYIICQREDKLVFIDQHAAHERMLYEDLKENNELLKPQTLAFPVELKLDRLRLDILREKSETLKNLGFEIEIKENVAIIKTFPVILPISRLEETLREIISELRIAEFVEESKVLDSIYAKLACVAAIKTSDKLSMEDIDELIKNLFRRRLLTCPHGRPLILEISERDLNKWFERS